mgnify:CR=1 FL=1
MEEFFEYTTVDEVDPGVVQYEGVTFTSAFGVFSDGEEVESLIVDYSDNRIESVDKNDDIIKTQRFKCVPVR